MKIGYHAGYGFDLQYGLELLVNRLHIEGFSAQVADERNAKEFDVLLFSLYWWKHFYEYLRFLARARIEIEKRKPLMVVGGVNITLNPQPIADFFHYAVIGDGEEALPALLHALAEGQDPLGIPGVYDPRSSGRVTMQNIENLPLVPTFSGIKQKQTRIEIARGCTTRCRFCALSHIKPYREVPTELICRAIRESKTKLINVYAPDRGGHSGFSEIIAAIYRHRKADSASDIRLDQLEKVERIGRVRFGLEGWSPRLRHAVGKRLSNERVCELMGNLANLPSTTKDHHSTCDVYFIADLPGEEEQDFLEMEKLLDMLCDVLPDSFALSMIPNIFSPQPQTALQWGPINLHTETARRWRKVTHGENRHRRNYKISAKVPGTQPADRLRMQLTLRGNRKTGLLLWNLVTNSKMIELRKGKDHSVANKIFRLATQCGMSREYLIGECPPDQSWPWDFIDNPTISTETRLKEWDRYCRISGYKRAHA